MALRCISAIDPGCSGALAFYFPDVPGRISAEDMPIAGTNVDAVTLANRLAAMAPDLCVIELVGAMPKQGVSSTFKFGRAFGTAIGVVGSLKVPLVFVTPQKWKKHFRLPSDKVRAARWLCGCSPHAPSTSSARKITGAQKRHCSRDTAPKPSEW
jgi:crossover junction endodeoxyribonuclease RuvC